MPGMRRRRRRRGVVRAVGATAVVAGTAGRVHHHQNEKWAEENQGQAEQEPEYYDEPAPAAAAEPDLASQLQDLADLHDQGVLSDEEFADAKAKLLN